MHSFQCGQFRNSSAWRKCLSLRWGGEATSGEPASLILGSQFCLFRHHKPLAAASVADSLAAPLPSSATLPHWLMLSSICPLGLLEGALPSSCSPQTLLCLPTKWDMFPFLLRACFAGTWELRKRMYLLIFSLLYQAIRGFRKPLWSDKWIRQVECSFWSFWMKTELVVSFIFKDI